MAGSTLHCRRLFSESGWLENVNLRIGGNGIIETIEEGAPQDSATTLSGPVIPGMPNCHSHAFQRQMAGLAGFRGPSGADSFWTWREIMYRLANSIDADAIEAIAYWLYVEMLEAGYTSCAEFHYLHHQTDGEAYAEVDELCGRLFSAASRAGLALTLVPTLYCRAGFDYKDASPQQRRFANDPERFLSILESSLDRAKDHPDHAVGLGLHSLRAVSRGQIEQVLDAENGRATAIHIHVAEQPAEVEQCMAAYGKRPVRWLLDNLPVDHRWCLVHATHMDEPEYEGVADSGAVVGLCPTTEADLGDGFFEAQRFLKLGGRIAIGSDSNLRISPAEELRLLENGMRLRTGRRNVLVRDDRGCGESLYSAALTGGGHALGQPLGGIAPGTRADLLELDEAHPMLAGVAQKDILERYVFAWEKGMIKSVFVAGRKRVRDGSHENRDEAAQGFSRIMEETGQ